MVNEEYIKSTGAFNRPLDDSHLDNAGDDATKYKSKERSPARNLIAFEIVHHDYRRDGKQVEQVHTDG